MFSPENTADPHGDENRTIDTLPQTFKSIEKDEGLILTRLPQCCP